MFYWGLQFTFFFILASVLLGLNINCSVIFLQNFHHSHSPSVDLHYHHKPRPMLPAHSHPGYRGNEEIISVGYHSYEGGTFPRKKENQRIR
jgi:hypothetical protein